MSLLRYFSCFYNALYRSSYSFVNVVNGCRVFDGVRNVLQFTIPQRFPLVEGSAQLLQGHRSDS